MSENVDIVRGFLRAFDDGDFAASVAAMHPEMVWTPPPTLPDVEIRRGKKAVVAAWTEWLRDWEYHRVEAEDVIEAPDGRVVVSLRQTFRGRGSGVEIESRDYIGVYEVADGKVASFTGFVDRAQALEAVGPSA